MPHCDKSTGRPGPDRRLVQDPAYLSHLYHVVTSDLPRPFRLTADDVATTFRRFTSASPLRVSRSDGNIPLA